MRRPPAVVSFPRSPGTGLALGLGCLLLALSPRVHADGTESLGPPIIPVAAGTQIIGSGAGLFVQPASIVLDVPATASVQQVILYWNGFDTAPMGPVGGSLTLNGSIPVTGSLIGGPTFFFAGAYSYTYRADITSLALVAPGTNTLTLDGSSFATADNGASIVVVIDDADVSSEIILRDGQDLAFASFAPPLNTTVAQSFAFAPVATDRAGELTILAGSVESPGVHRPSIVRVVSGGVTTDFNDVLASFSGRQWDHLVLPVTIPAGADELTVQVLSADCCASGNPPASLVWVGAGLVAFPATGEVAGLVYFDLDDDASFDANETGLPGVEIELQCAGSDGTLGTADDISQVTVSDGSGQYLFLSVPAGLCSVTLGNGALPLGAEIGQCSPSVTVTVAQGLTVVADDLCLRPDTTPDRIADRLWLPVPSNDDVLVLDANGQVEGMLDTAQQDEPVAVTVGPTGVVWVVFESSDSLARYSNLGSLLGVVPVDDDPRIITSDASGGAWVAHVTPRVLTRLASDGSVLRGLGGSLGGPLPLNAEPRGLATDSLNNLYVVTADPARLEKRNQTGDVYTAISLPAGSEASEVAVDRAGYVWVVLQGLDAVERRASDLALIETFDLPENSGLSRMVIRGAGEAWVLAGTTGTVHRLEAGGQSSSFALGGTLSGLAVDGRGQVWVADSSSSNVRRLDPSGQLQQTVALSGPARFRGDTSGIHQVNVLRPASDSDADGSSNAVEIDNLSNVFDPTSDPSELPSFVAPLLSLSCNAVVTNVTLHWVLPLMPYTSIEVRRGGVLRATLPGTATQFSEPAGLSEGIYDYQVQGISGGDVASATGCVAVVGAGQLQSVVGLQVGDLAVNVFDITTATTAGPGAPRFYLTDPANGKVYGTDANFQVLIVIDSPFQGIAPTTGIAFDPNGDGGLGSLLLAAGANGDPLQIATVIEVSLTGMPLGLPIQLFRTGGAGLRQGIGTTPVRGGLATLAYKPSSDLFMATGTQNCELFAFRTSGKPGGLTTGGSQFDTLQILPDASAQHPIGGYSLNGIYLTDFANFDETGGRVWVTSPTPNGGFELTVLAIAGGAAQIVGPAIPLASVMAENSFGGFTVSGDSLSVVGLTTSQVHQLGSAFFSRGDTDGNQVYDVGDAIRILSSLFEGFPFRTCVDAYDFDDGGTVNLSDGVLLLTYMFAGGAPPGSPLLPLRGPDPTPDDLPCL